MSAVSGAACRTRVAVAVALLALMRASRARSGVRRLVRIERHPAGPRLFVLGRRQHHGRTGAELALLGAAVRDLRLAIAGLALCVHDAHDFPWPA